MGRSQDGSVPLLHVVVVWVLALRGHNSVQQDIILTTHIGHIDTATSQLDKAQSRLGTNLETIAGAAIPKTFLALLQFL